MVEPGGKRVGFVLGAVLSVIGVALLGAGIFMLWQGHACQGWPKADGVVTKSDIRSSKSTNRGAGDRRRTTYTHRAEVEYTYELAGKTYTGKRIRYGYFGSDSAKKEQALADRYPTGRRIQVRYNPGDPDESVLEAGSTWVPWIFVALGAVFLLPALSTFWIKPRTSRFKGPPCPRCGRPLASDEASMCVSCDWRKT